MKLPQINNQSELLVLNNHQFNSFVPRRCIIIWFFSFRFVEFIMYRQVLLLAGCLFIALLALILHCNDVKKTQDLKEGPKNPK